MAERIYRYMLKFIVILLLFSGTVFAQDMKEPAEQQMFLIEDQKYQVSLYRLAANPDQFAGKKVFLTGYVSFLSGFYIFPDRSSCEDAFYVNSLYIPLISSQYQGYASKVKNNCQLKRVSGNFIQVNNYGQDKTEPLVIGHLDIDRMYDY